MTPLDPKGQIQDSTSRREFLKWGTAVSVGSLLPISQIPAQDVSRPAETAVKGLFESLTPEQKKEVCFDWDHQDKTRGLLRTFVSNNWQITKHNIRSPFYNKKQQDIIHDVFKGLVNPEWYSKFLKQLKDDTGGKEWGNEQSIAIFGKPGEGKFEFVMTGRHMTLRADGNSESHVAFGGPIFYGHAADTFNEGPDHKGNVFWPQALEANKVFKILDEDQRKLALANNTPGESDVRFKGTSELIEGLPVGKLDSTQQKQMQKVLKGLIEPFRQDDQNEALACLDKQGGLSACRLTFYKQGDIGKDGVWDNWRLEGPAFVWYFRGSPHVHVWVNVADDPTVKLNAKG